ncbi:MAG: hypothetical protein HY000_22300 [Planctomycetes bacterium]|nr:hypothetical protein [Planctomycetota bacterium]
MTTLQLHLFNCLYLAVLVVVAFFTRATARRIAGALAGGAAFGVVALGIIALGEEVRWWHMAITWKPYFLTLLLIDFVLCAFIYLITWRIARRFGWRGLAVVVVVAPPVGNRLTERSSGFWSFRVLLTFGSFLVVQGSARDRGAAPLIAGVNMPTNVKEFRCQHVSSSEAGDYFQVMFEQTPDSNEDMCLFKGSSRCRTEANATSKPMTVSSVGTLESETRSCRGISSV